MLLTRDVNAIEFAYEYAMYTSLRCCKSIRIFHSFDVQKGSTSSPWSSRRKRKTVVPGTR